MQQDQGEAKHVGALHRGDRRRENAAGLLPQAGLPYRTGPASAMPKARYVPDADFKILWGRAAARCAFPGCRLVCVAERTAVDGEHAFGKVAHIVAHSDTGPRGDPSFPDADRDKYENLLLLCANHHDIVDGQHSSYGVADLRAWKTDHERWVRDSLSRAVPQVGFAELEIVCSALLVAELSQSSTFSVLAIQEKMERNHLTAGITPYMQLGLASSREVGSFVTHMAARDATFPERLKAGFLAEYRRLRATGIEGDGLFESLRAFAAAPSADFKRQATGLTVLVHLFEICEVFEK